MFRRLPEVRSFALVSLLAIAVTACGLGERPSIGTTPTAIGTVTGEPAIDDVLTRLDEVDAAVFTADYTAVLAFGGTSSAVTVSQDGTEPTAIRRSVTIGDVRFITTADNTSSCTVSSKQCTVGIDAARVSDTGVTPEFTFGDMAKRLRRDAVARVGTAVASTRDIAGSSATCVDVPVTGGTKEYCVFDNGVLARYVGGDVTIDATALRPTVDDTLFVV